MIKTTLVGFDRQAKLYAEVIRTHPSFHLRAIVVPDVEARQRAQAYAKHLRLTLPVVCSAGHWQEQLQASQLVVFGDGPTSRLQILQALNAGVAVLCASIELAAPEDLVVYFRTAAVQCTPFVIDWYRRFDARLQTMPAGPTVTTMTTSGPSLAPEVDLMCWLFRFVPTAFTRLKANTLLLRGQQGCIVIHWESCHSAGPFRIVLNYEKRQQPFATLQLTDKLTEIDHFWAARRLSLFHLASHLSQGTPLLYAPTLDECLQVKTVLDVARDSAPFATVPLPPLGKRVYNMSVSPPSCVQLYRLQRQHQTRARAEALAEHYARGGNLCMSVWDALQRLRTLVDQSDPDLVGLPNDVHALQTAQLLEDDGCNEYWVAMGLVHDLGKIMFLFGCDKDGTSAATQWGVVGDTFVTGWPLPASVPFPEFGTSDDKQEQWSQGVGLANVTCSFGHDEYLYQALVRNREKHRLPQECMDIIRFHSLYAWHSHGAYAELENASDRALKPYVQLFQAYDLYSKSKVTNHLSWDHPKWRELVERVFGTELWDF